MKYPGPPGRGVTTAPVFGFDRQFAPADGPATAPVVELTPEDFEDLSRENAQLRRAVHELRAERLQSVATLAGGIAHDLNNVLTPILMSIALLDEELQDSESQRLLRVLDDSAQRGAAMVRQIREFARGLNRPNAAVDLKHLLEDVRRFLAGTLPRSIELVVEVAPGISGIKADANELRQVIVNLCLNACDCMPGGGRLVLRAEPVEIHSDQPEIPEGARPGSYIAISVIDTGNGMSGTRPIARVRGSFFEVDAQAGRGTTVRVCVPACALVNESEQQPLPAAARGRNELILIVDDEASTRAITAQVLTAYGYRVITAANGVEAVTEFAKRPHEIAAVVTDMMMPVMDGASTMRALQTIAPDVKLIAATTLDNGAIFDDVPGVAAVLPKPFRAETLLGALRQILDGSR